MTTTDPRIYVASLSDYNGGKLHGVWIDATDELDDIWSQINAMLKASPEFKEFPQGGPAEEWAIHDYEGFHGVKLSEYEDIERVHKIACAIEENGPAMAAWLGISDDNDPDDFDAHFRGEWESEEDFARETVMEIGWSNVPAQVYLAPYAQPEDHTNIFDELSSYIDWEAIARDLVQHGNYTAVRHDGNLYIFEDGA